MDLLRRIAISNGDQIKKDAATATMAQEDQQVIANWNKELEEEVWQRILDRIERRGYAGIGKNNIAVTPSGKAQHAHHLP